MKYLKTFENSDTDKPDITSHLTTIKAIFQDYIDEYDIEELPDDLDEDDDTRPGFYYHLYWVGTDFNRRKLYFEFNVYVIHFDGYINDYYDTESFKNQYNILNKKVENFIKNNDKIKSQLKSFDYDCIIKTDDDSFHQSFKISYQF
jgi:hypothetical protein